MATTTTDACSTEEKAPQQQQSKSQQRRRVPFPRPRPVLPEDGALPKPRKLSTTSTPLTNDPLWSLSSVIEGERGLVSEESIKLFYADAAGYVSLVEQEYHAISDCDKFVTKTVPQSAFAYFHHVLWWYKVAINAQRRGTASEAQERLIHFVNGYDIKIGSGSATYLAGMGDFTDGSGVKHYLTANEPNNEGHFGMINEQTHRDYETLIAPAMSINRVLSDVGYTLDRNEVEFRMPDGVLPDAPAPVGRPPAPPAALPRLRPRRRDIPEAEHEDLNLAQGIEDDARGEEDVPEYRGPQRNRMLPTANLLGWRTPVTLNKNQMAEMSTIFDDPDDVEFQNQRYRVHRELFEYVYRRLRECQRYKLSSLPKSINGQKKNVIIDVESLAPTIVLVMSNSQGHKSNNYVELVEYMLSSFEELWCNMSIKNHFLRSNLIHFHKI